MNRLKKNLYRYKLLYLVLLFFIIRLWNLTLLPIFNDEAIYIHWGIKELQSGNLYYSLYDSKQPLLMWIFAVSAGLFSDPLWGARIVSVLCGLGGMIGLYLLGKQYFSGAIGLWSAGLYTVIPIFSLYDRQALMETAVGTIGVWFIYFTLKFWQKPSLKNAIIIGIIGGIGEFIKTSSLLFVTSFVLLVLIGEIKGKWRREKSREVSEKKKGYLLNTAFVLLTMVCVDSLLFINPMFWQTLSSNSRYSLTLSEIMHFPFAIWWNNLESNLEIMWWYLTPLVFLGGIWGTRKIGESRDKEKWIFLWMCLIPLILETFLSRGSTQRYLVSFLPLLMICTAVGIKNFVDLDLGIMGNWGKKGIVILGVGLAVIMTGLQLINPVGYFRFYSHLTRLSDIGEYYSTQNSGEGVSQVVKFLQNKSSEQSIIVATAVNTGNPEDALYIYLAKDKNANLIYMDNRFLGNQLNGIVCLSSIMPLYFISRDEQQGGMNQYLQQIESIHNPYGENRIGIYTLRHNCKGKTLRLD